MYSALAFITAAVLSYLFTVPAIKLAKKYRLITDAKKRSHPAHTHTGVIPRGGGGPIYLAILIVSLIFLPLNKIMTGILLSSFLLVITGLLDDYYDLSPYFRFAVNLLISMIVVGFGLGIPFISVPFLGVVNLAKWSIGFQFFGVHSVLVLADLVAIVWLTWTMNMVNWSKGVDGQLPGFVAITAFFMGILAQRFIHHDISIQTVTLLSFIISGAFLGFLPFNFFPQRIMPGYGGGALAGFLLGILSILSFGKVGTAILILAIPMIDGVYTIIRRLANGRSPFRADSGHFHHQLLDIGWGKRRVAVFYWSVSLLLGIASLFLKGVEKLLAFLAVAAVLLVFIFTLSSVKKETSR
ncbi:undecaprenyl/decaprenyl-phosphate alpha-N-acetylglucosaminyl 1-phosphate transferase [Candidatus Roizmanbacteria bacterium]|nr:undecaprenyl/decaprenyl-phosphate alpha-N-acetylglucosaminyl 1-phosphate transferase [Candidatus Roizmanbacteria bacterium]